MNIIRYTCGKKEFIEQFKIKNQMKGKTGFERKKLEKKLKKRNHK